MDGDYALKITSSLPKKFSVVVGFPGVGLAGYIASDTVITQCKMEEIGYVDVETTPPVSIVIDATPKHPIRVFKCDDMVLIKSEVPIMPDIAARLGDTIVHWAREHNADRIIILDAISAPGRAESESETKVWGITTTEKFEEAFNGLDVNPMEKGMIIGLPSEVLVDSKDENVDCIGLFAESNVEIPDPRAAASLVHKLGDLLHKKFDTKDLIEKATEIETAFREQMAAVMEALKQGGPSGEEKEGGQPSMFG
ncbi:MAG: PAC2 family protein [Thermoplasmata archaeon]